jgi:hypothetical protein
LLSATNSFGIYVRKRRAWKTVVGEWGGAQYAMQGRRPERKKAPGVPEPYYRERSTAKFFSGALL